MGKPVVTLFTRDLSFGCIVQYLHILVINDLFIAVPGQALLIICIQTPLKVD